jgi:ATP phosphoribosyltransferase
VSRPLTLAVPKGRVLKVLVPLLAKAGYDASSFLSDDRALVRATACGRLEALLLKPDDVPTYVERGVASLGVVGRDVLDEKGSELFRVLDLRVGVCRLAVAAPVGFSAPRGGVLRVATKYPKLALAHYAKKGEQVDVVKLHGSVELGAVTSLADVIVDLVETGRTLVENGLEVIEEVSAVSSVVVANRAAWKVDSERLRAFVASLEAALAADVEDSKQL